ncbi:MAG: helix-turn-helix domain-containing protein [Kiritimatiellaceae bacterium]|nr:helix-turn-helix domain-containing protein [Kiritimatiellaceae bacterium]
MSLLSDILSSRTRAGIFSALFGLGAQDLHAREIARQTGVTLATVQQELKKLVEMDLVTRRKDGNRVYFQANIRHPLFTDIQNLTVKTSGVVPLLREALEPVSDEISSAFIFGSMARSAEQAHSDVDIMIIGNAGLRQISALIAPVCQKLDREINPHTMTAGTFSARMKEGDVFLANVVQSEKLFLIGGADELGAMV